MPFNWKLKSKPPHDFFLCLDVNSYFDYEHDPALIPENGMVRALSLKDRDILVRVFFNGDSENPVFTIESEDKPGTSEIEEANTLLARILGTELDLNPLYEQASNDPLLSTMFSELYGLKRMSRATFFEDAVNRIIIAQISHKPTAKKMVYGVRTAHGTRLEDSNGVVYGWPRPSRLMNADPVALKEHGLSLRKGEYIVGLAHELMSGSLTLTEAESMAPVQFYNRLLQIRGIGPTTAQDLMLFRNRPDAVFPSNMDKGIEKGLRKWIVYAYGESPEHTDEKEFNYLIRKWKGYESLALEYLFVNWILSEKKKKMGR
jgi:DNA-3-methyladenine glycosylase II